MHELEDPALRDDALANADLLLGERMVHDAFRSEAGARAEAMRAITKLRIDSHELWLED